MKKFNNLLIDDFLIEKELCEWLSKKSLICYLSVFSLLLQNEYIIASDLSTYTTTNFKRLLANSLLSKNWSSNTYNSYRKYYRVFCEYLKREWFFSENPIDNILKRKVPQALPKTLSEKQIKELVDSLDSTYDTNSFFWLRNKTIVLTFLFTGLRRSELSNVKICDIDFSEWFLKVIKGKWSKDRIIPFGDDLRKILFFYCRLREKSYSDSSDFLFPTSWGLRLQDRDMKTILDKVRTGVMFHFTWHQLRHTFATHLVRNNFDIYNISQLLGHSKIETTKIYLSVDPQKLKKQINLISLYSLALGRTT